ncbi:amidohydrolase family protein [Paenibacillus sp. HJL G12]|uniref:Amidohydrolase family protein n=1 Tax=Paenibacillus dendrobii TaxID=2691084 RepID=A0A7X3IIA2_9BACL|nr:amidohydrolase [Paenibacillus dendrobii]MWV43876.1 amidohydrolase family protein [Paenibacillus dendrobii]
MEHRFWLVNARLESSYQVQQNVITGTETEIRHLLIEDGNITKIIPADQPIADQLPQMDAGFRLVLPSFVEKHCHLDKALLGGRWRAVTPAKSIFGRLDEEREFDSKRSLSIRESAENYLEASLKSGATHIRTHVDIFPEVGLTHLEEVQEALRKYEDKLSYEIVAFPQQGLLRSGSEQLVREAIRKGAGLVGGVDPATVDGDVEKSLQTMVKIASEENAGIDLHLHDPDRLGIFTIKRLAELTIEAGLQGRVAVSHAFSLGDIPAQQAAEMAELLAAADMTIITSVPMGRKFPPVRLLHDHGVSVAVGCDNVFDIWSPFGNGDIMERAGRLAEISHWVDELSLGQTLGYITDGITPLDQTGKQAWPKAGDEASLVLVEASCSAEAVARRAKRTATLYKGNVVAGSLNTVEV